MPLCHVSERSGRDRRIRCPSVQVASIYLCPPFSFSQMMKCVLFALFLLAAFSLVSEAGPITKARLEVNSQS